MDISIHNPTRKECTVLETANNKPFAVARFACQGGGEASMIFDNPDELRNHATALRLLAEALEEKRA